MPRLRSGDSNWSHVLRRTSANSAFSFLRALRFRNSWRKSRRSWKCPRWRCLIATGFMVRSDFPWRAREQKIRANHRSGINDGRWQRAAGAGGKPPRLRQSLFATHPGASAQRSKRGVRSEVGGAAGICAGMVALVGVVERLWVAHASRAVAEGVPPTTLKSRSGGTLRQHARRVRSPEFRRPRAAIDRCFRPRKCLCRNSAAFFARRRYE